MTTGQSTQESWLKLGEAAFALGVSEITLRRKIKAGRIPFELRDGKYFVLVDGSAEPVENTIAEVQAPRTQSPQRATPQRTNTLPQTTTTPTLTRPRTPSVAPQMVRQTSQPSRQANVINSAEPFSHSLMSATIDHARLQARIDELEMLASEQEETIIELRRQFEDQQTLIAFLEERIRLSGN